VKATTIRYYEQRGVLPPATRSAAGYRLYPQSMLRRLIVVRSAQRFGFSLERIAGFLKVRDTGGKPCETVRAAAEHLLSDVDRQIAALRERRRRLRDTLRKWDAILARTPADRRAHLLERLGT